MLGEGEAEGALAVPNGGLSALEEDDERCGGGEASNERRGLRWW